LKKAFGLLIAIFIMLLLSSIMVLTLNIQSNKAKKTADDYLSLQAELLAKSAEEYAIMCISGYDRAINDGCLEELNINAKPFDVNVTMWYMFSAGQKPVNCNRATQTTMPQKQNGTVLIDVIVRTQSGQMSEPIVTHHRTIQMP
jgi:hypothetical protein